jgi:hypothetical protein
MAPRWLGYSSFRPKPTSLMIQATLLDRNYCARLRMFEPSVLSSKLIALIMSLLEHDILYD